MPYVSRGYNGPNNLLKLNIKSPWKRAEVGVGLPFSVFSCSVSVRVRLEFALLDKHELRPDLVLLRPHNLTACSGDMTPSVSVSGSEPTLTE